MRLGVDVGGTFTDLVALHDDGRIDVRKVATTPEDPAVGLFRAVDGYRSSVVGGPVPVEALIHGTTIATNALLERRGARIALVTTAGFEDLLWLRRQDRADLYDLSRHHPPPLLTRDHVVGVHERMGPDGVLVELTDAEVKRVVAAVQTLRPDAVAIACLFAFRHPEHERRLAAALRAALLDVQVAASCEVLPVFREYERTSTTTAEAYLRPKVSAYVARAEAAARQRGIESLRIMTSSGGTMPPQAAAIHAAALALSGPAGGVVGARLAGEAVGLTDLLTLDMGGTSADASLILGGGALAEGAGVVGGVPLALPAVLIETVSAGGGSIAWIDTGGALKVGPRSAGAVPGPASYGRGGTEPTVTDACLVLGWLDPGQPLADDVRLDLEAARRSLAALGMTIAALGMTRLRNERAIATGIVAVATAVMARALKRVSVARGVDPRRMALLPFGGAGPLFGCALAEALGMRVVVVPPHPGALSALGLAAAAERVEAVASLHRQLEAVTAAEIEAGFAPLVERVRSELPGGLVRQQADCRFVGQGYEVPVAVLSAEPAIVAQVFRAAHRTRFGFASDEAPIELVNLRVVAERGGGTPVLRRPAAPSTGQRPGGGGGRREVVVRGETVVAEVWPLDDLPPGVTIAGPAILAGGDATALVEPGWLATAHVSGAVVIERR
jgi:N-methylhydantoinase A